MKKLSDIKEFFRENNPFDRAFFERTKKTLVTKITSIRIDKMDIIKTAVLLLLMLIFLSWQTTFLSKWKIFGVVPDLLLPFVIVASVKEKERWGMVFALISGIFADALGAGTVSLMPLIYVSAALVCSWLSKMHFKDAFIVKLVYTAVAAAVKSTVSLFIALGMKTAISFGDALTDVMLPELALTILLSPVIILITSLSLRPFHKSREERTDSDI